MRVLGAGAVLQELPVLKARVDPLVPMEPRGPQALMATMARPELPVLMVRPDPLELTGTTAPPVRKGRKVPRA